MSPRVSFVSGTCSVTASHSASNSSSSTSCTPSRVNRQHVGRPHLRSEREQPRRDGVADPPEADDPDTHAGERSQRAGGPRVPFAACNSAIELDDASQQRVEQRERVVGDLLGAVVGHADDRDAAPLRRFDVHVVEADAGRSDDAQSRQLRHQLLPDRLRRHRQHCDDVVLRRGDHVETGELGLRVLALEQQQLHSTSERKRRVRSCFGAEKNSSGGASSTIRPSSIISTELAT